MEGTSKVPLGAILFYFCSLTIPRIIQVATHKSSYCITEKSPFFVLHFEALARSYLESRGLQRGTIEYQDRFEGRARIIIVGGATVDDLNYWTDLGLEAKVYKKVSRGGLIETGFKGNQISSGCKYNREKEWFHILSTGEVALCCMDWERRYILGDLKQSTIQEVWNGDLYQEVRGKVSLSEDLGFICNNCEWGNYNDAN